MPDGGLFTADQVQKGADAPLKGQPPARGVIECKPVRSDVGFTADTKQVTDYWDKYRQVLVTNYRDFLLVAADERTGEPVKRESFSLGVTEKEFWKASPAALAKAASDRLLEYLQRVLLHPVPLAYPKDVAWFLASYARDARARLEVATHLESLDKVREGLEQALGVKFDGPKGEHFFRSTLVQTLFYGVFSAWVLWHRGVPKPKERFDWEKSAKFLHVPILHKLFHELADPKHLDDWKLSEVLEWTGELLNRVNRSEFFSRFQDIEAVQYFYEPFLEAFDPELRKQLGVWYTPREVVQYMVARVDTVLREELKRPDGLADDGVYILDPCCGTGAYLVEVLRTIAARLQDQGEEAMLGQRLKKAATERLFGFELLPAPFVVAHLQLGLFLQSAGVPLVEKKGERAGVYLTNALTGWEPPKGPKQRLLFSELEEERDRAERVKQQTPILVVLGNPPYSGFAGIAQVEEERDLSEAYRWKDGDPEDLRPEGQGLNDLYVRFFRMAERCVVERNLRYGVVCFISNYSWLDSRSCPLMRLRYLQEFDEVWIDCLNGDKYKTGKLTPDGRPDPSVFSTEHNREGIQVGTAIALLLRKDGHW
jgi:N-6 DNA Methylase